MKSIWTEGFVRWHRPIKSRMKILWTLWAVAFALLALWLAGLATGHLMRGWIHAALAGAFVVAGFCVVYGVKYCEFLEPRFLKWIGGSRFRHSRPSPTDPPAPEEARGDSGRGA